MTTLKKLRAISEKPYVAEETDDDRVVYDALPDLLDLIEAYIARDEASVTIPLDGHRERFYGARADVRELLKKLDVRHST